MTFIESGRTFGAGDIVHWSDADRRTLAEAVAEADLLVSCPHAGAEIPGELAPWIHPSLTRRLQFDFSDVTTREVVRRWARIDPSIVYVENPHPRFVRDPNRPRPADPAADLTEALRRVRDSGGDVVDLAGVDAIRPVSFAGLPVLRVPETDAGIAELVEVFLDVGRRGVDVYQSTRLDLIEQMVAARGRSPSRPVTVLSFHDTMNRTARPDGAVAVERRTEDRLPDVVTLSNRGDAAGNPRPEDPAVTMEPERLRMLADSHRTAFRVSSHDEVALNVPYLGSDEIISVARRYAASVGPGVDAVQAEFRREYLLGAAAAATVMQPGTGWPAVDSAHLDRIADRCRRAWHHYRATLG